ATDPKERCRGSSEKGCMARNTVLSQEPSTSIEQSDGHFELLVVEEGARPVITPMANPPTAPARIPIRIRNFAFSRMEVLCLTGGLRGCTSAQILSQFVHRKGVQTNEIFGSCWVLGCTSSCNEFHLRQIIGQT